MLFAGVLEFGIGRGYGIGDRHLRNLPDLPLARHTITWVVAGFAGYVGAATMLLVIRSGVRPRALALVVFVFATAVAAIPLAALLRHGVVLPTLLFAVFVPYILGMEVVTTTDSPVHILLFGPYSLVLLIAWAVEKKLRTRSNGGNSGRFGALDTE